MRCVSQFTHGEGNCHKKLPTRPFALQKWAVWQGARRLGEAPESATIPPNAPHRRQSAVADRYLGRGSVPDDRAPDRELRSGSLLDLRRASRTSWDLIISSIRPD